MTTKNELGEAIVIERTLNAPVANVWQALTEVEQMRQWYFDLKEFRPEPGFEFEFIVEHEGAKYHHVCKVTEAIRTGKSPTPGAIRESRAIRWSRLNYFLTVTRPA